MSLDQMEPPPPYNRRSPLFFFVGGGGGRSLTSTWIVLLEAETWMGKQLNKREIYHITPKSDLTTKLLQQETRTWDFFSF